MLWCSRSQTLEEAVRLALPEASDLAAIVGALRCVSEERWEQAQELLRPVPAVRCLPLGRVLVKGMIAFYVGDPEKVEALFAQLPPHGVPVRAANALRLFLGSDHSKKLRRTCGRTGGKRRMLSAQRDGAGAVATACGPMLGEQERHVDSYKEMRQAPGFPSEQPDAGRCAIRFLF